MVFHHLVEQPDREIIPGYRARFLHTDHLTLAYWDVEQDAPLPEHSHPHEQVAQVLEGKYQLTVDGETRTLMPGDAAVIPGGVPHSGLALTACRLLDVFHPVREEYR